MSVLEDHELDAIILAAAALGPVNEAELEKIADWAQKVRIDQAVLDNVIAGEIVVRCRKSGEIEFQAASAALGNEGAIAHRVRIEEARKADEIEGMV